MKASILQKENIARINKAILYIEEHLSEKLSLETIAEKAHFSQFHFHRLFKLTVKYTYYRNFFKSRIFLYFCFLKSF